MIGAQVFVAADEQGAARLAAAALAGALRAILGRNERATLGLSGGTTPWDTYRALAEEDLDWSRVTLLQVDERDAPEGDSDRNLTGIRSALADRVPATMVPLAGSLAVADERYSNLLGSPPAMDLVVLGIGDDGHTASLVPGDPVLDATGTVARTAEYRGHRRLTMTYPVLCATPHRIVIAHGPGKSEPINEALCGRLPAGRIPGLGTALITTAETWEAPA